MKPVYECEPCAFGACHRCTGCLCADDHHGGLVERRRAVKDFDHADRRVADRKLAEAEQRVAEDTDAWLAEMAASR